MLRQNCLRVFKKQVIGTINLEHRKKIFYRAMLRSHSHSCVWLHSLKSHIESTYSHIDKLYFCNVFSVSPISFKFMPLFPLPCNHFSKKYYNCFKNLFLSFFCQTLNRLGSVYSLIQENLVINCLQNSLCFPSRVEVCLILFLSVHVNWFPRILTQDNRLSQITGFLGYKPDYSGVCSYE